MSLKFDRYKMDVACKQAWDEAWIKIDKAKQEAWLKYCEDLNKAHLLYYGPDPSDATMKYEE